MAKIVNNQDFVSRDGKSNHQLWNELCDLISKNPKRVRFFHLLLLLLLTSDYQITTLNVDAIIRGGLRKYTDQVGHLWNSLADFYIRYCCYFYYFYCHFYYLDCHFCPGLACSSEPATSTRSPSRQSPRSGTSLRSSMPTLSSRNWL